MTPRHVKAICARARELTAVAHAMAPETWRRATPQPMMVVQVKQKEVSK